MILPSIKRRVECFLENQILMETENFSPNERFFSIFWEAPELTHHRHLNFPTNSQFLTSDNRERSDYVLSIVFICNPAEKFLFSVKRNFSDLSRRELSKFTVTEERRDRGCKIHRRIESRIRKSFNFSLFFFLYISNTHYTILTLPRPQIK